MGVDFIFQVSYEQQLKKIALPRHMYSPRTVHDLNTVELHYCYNKFSSVAQLCPTVCDPMNIVIIKVIMIYYC